MMMQKQNLFVREERFSIFLSSYDEKDKFRLLYHCITAMFIYFDVN